MREISDGETAIVRHTHPAPVRALSYELVQRQKNIETMPIGKPLQKLPYHGNPQLLLTSIKQKPLQLPILKSDFIKHI